MTKKILAGVLASVSLLSLSATAFASSSSDSDSGSSSSGPALTGTVSGAVDANGISYDVSAGLSFGEVDCVVPSAAAFAQTGAVVVNPYGAAISTTLADGSTKVNNTSFVASKVFNITNNDTENGLKVLAAVSVKKATGLVIVDGEATEPLGWDVAKDKAGVTIDRSKEFSTTYNPLISYDKISIKYKDDKVTIDTATGGAQSLKQAMNTAVYLVGGTASAKAVAENTGTSNTRVNFAAKGTNTKTLLELGEKGGTGKDEGFFTVKGDLNPTINTEQYAWGKENLSLSIVLKLIPVVPTT